MPFTQASGWAKMVYSSPATNFAAYQHVLEPLYAYLMITAKQYEDGKYAGYYNVGPDDVDCFQTGALVDLFVSKWGEGLQWINRYDGGPHEANFLKLDCSKLKATFGWKPRWNLDTAIEKVVEWSKCWINGEDVRQCMFSYYIDSENVPDVVAELWTNAAAFFSIFITRCLTDFPENDFYKNVLNDTSRLDKNVLLGRLNLLRHWKIKDDDDPFVLYGIVRNEYEFWKSIKIPETEDVETYGILKINGLNLVAKQFGGWSRYDVSDMVEAINESLKVNTGIATKIMNQFFLQEHITELSKAGFFEEAEYLRGKSEEILEKEDDSSWTSVIQLQNLNAEMMENILQDNFWKAYEVLKRMDAKCSLADINSVRVFAHSCFNIDHLSSTYKPSYTGKGYKLLQKAELLYPTDPSINARIVGCKVLILQKNYFENKIDNVKLMSELIPLEAVLSEMVSDGEHDTENAISIAWGLLLTLKLNCVKTDEDELNSLICLSTEILKDHPNYGEVASAKIMATCVLHENILHTKVSHAEVEELFKFVEMNNYSNSLRECFFNMLDKSEDSSLRANYITKKVALGARQGAAYDPLIGSGIVEFDEEADLLRQIYEYTTQEPYVRDHRKYGANEKCPCGSGLKFKKCCKGKGIYD